MFVVYFAPLSRLRLLRNRLAVVRFIRTTSSEGFRLHRTLALSIYSAPNSSLSATTSICPTRLSLSIQDPFALILSPRLRKGRSVGWFGSRPFRRSLPGSPARNFSVSISRLTKLYQPRCESEITRGQLCAVSDDVCVGSRTVRLDRPLSVILYAGWVIAFFFCFVL